MAKLFTEHNFILKGTGKHKGHNIRVNIYQPDKLDSGKYEAKRKRFASQLGNILYELGAIKIEVIKTNK
jgi:hypothetical protein